MIFSLGHSAPYFGFRFCTDFAGVTSLVDRDCLFSRFQLRSCTICNKPEAEPPNPRSQVQPGNENIGDLPLIENAARSEFQPT